MKLCTVGLGYIGLPTSIMFANYDVDVVGVDVKKEAVDMLNSGKIHIEEPGLQEALEKAIEKGKFRASMEPEKADAFIIAVPTPNKEDEYLSCDLSFVMQATENIIPHLEKGNVVIVESTIAPRTMDDYVKPRLEKAGFTIGEDIFLVHCPERVLPGQIMHELIHNNRIVGGITPQCTEKGAEVYATFVKGELIKTDARTAEMSKLMENTFRDVNIALANELTKVCNELGINALEVIEMANKHPRVNLHTPGPGVGGHCLAVDPYFIIAKAPEQAKLISLSRQINKSMPEYVIENVEKLLSKYNGKKITVFGLTYKGNVDDIRESPAMDIYEELNKRPEFEVVAYDPHVKLSFVEQDLEKALTGSDLVLILSDHNEFKNLNSEYFKKMNVKQVFDTKNIVKNHVNELIYVNYGNLYKFI
ncbi:nucleotide sugar dehydrogenase [Ornithinibacillus bavariensis]|uniref:Nucleotide sugar dehydrogenase n=1 Tax=Ornithinibacillus bavariensis TaxID=545502 RepID=A0A919X9M0_9BACI|nr:nucleotide sugar dehydrogenase [Ornithinibacillus bavariensis]GIO26917.1 nucleotide sugar dehydrogenase [Ornithinibacillus bavariensis]